MYTFSGATAPSLANVSFFSLSLQILVLKKCRKVLHLHAQLQKLETQVFVFIYIEYK